MENRPENQVVTIAESPHWRINIDPDRREILIIQDSGELRTDEIPCITITPDQAHLLARKIREARAKFD